jgi:hypothetical protein
MVAYGGESFDPPDGPYLIADDVRLNGIRRYQASDSENWQTGDLIIGVMVPLNWTDMQSAEYAGRIADYFAQDLLMAYDGVELRVARNPVVSGAGYRDGNRFRIPVVVPWEGWV